MGWSPPRGGSTIATKFLNCRTEIFPSFEEQPLCSSFLDSRWTFSKHPEAPLPLSSSWLELPSGFSALLMDSILSSLLEITLSSLWEKSGTSFCLWGTLKYSFSRDPITSSAYRSGRCTNTRHSCWEANMKINSEKFEIKKWYKIRKKNNWNYIFLFIMICPHNLNIAMKTSISCLLLPPFFKTSIAGLFHLNSTNQVKNKEPKSSPLHKQIYSFWCHLVRHSSEHLKLQKHSFQYQQPGKISKRNKNQKFETVWLNNKKRREFLNGNSSRL